MNWALIGALVINMTSYAYIGLAVTSRNNSVPREPAPDDVSVNLPSPWVSQDVGNVGVGGGASHINGIFTISGAGDDIWNTSDAFHYVYQPLTGDGEVTALIESVESTHEWAKVGVMIRESLEPDSPHAMMVMTPGNSPAFQGRVGIGNSSTHFSSGGVAVSPHWVKIVRSGDNFSGYESSDGMNWTLVGTLVINMAGNAHTGLAVTSHNNSVLNTSVFSNVSVTTGSDPTPPPPAYGVTAAPSAITTGGAITVNWTAPAGHSATDWVGLYRLGDPDTNFIAWQYTGAATSGGMTFTAPSEAGQYEFRYFLNDGYTRAATSNTVTASVPPPAPIPTPPPPPTAQSPYSGSPTVIPGTIQAEDFDNGGETVAYHDTDLGNVGGQYRTNTDVDIKVSADAGGGYAVGWFATGEWLEYTIAVPSTGNYNLEVRVASAVDAGKFHIEFNGVDKTGLVTVPNTGLWDTATFQTITISNASLSAGVTIMRVFCDAQYFDLNYIRITAVTPTPTPIPTPTPTPTGRLFYISSSTGSDNNNGLSAEAPWRTINKVNASSFQPGDQILFKRGEVWREQLIVPSSGSSGKPITFGAYGSGGAPKITGADMIGAADWSLTGGTSNTYRKPLSSDPGNVVLEDGKLLSKRTSVVDVEATAGSFYWASNTLYVHPSNNANPATNGKIYEVAVRDYAVNSGARSELHFTELAFKGARLRSFIGSGSRVVLLRSSLGQANGGAVALSGEGVSLRYSTIADVMETTSVALDLSGTNSSTYHNTFYNCRGTLERVSANGYVSKNNLLHLRDSQQYALRVEPNVTDTPDVDYNLYYRPTIKHGFHQDLSYWGDGYRVPRVTAVKQLGGAVSRSVLGWWMVESTRGSYDWSRIDKVLAELEAAGVEPLFFIGGSPQWANGSSDHWVVPGTSTSDSSFTTWVDRYEAFVRAVITRYNTRVKKWELWNEANENYFWKPSNNVVMYGSWYQRMYTAIKAIDPNAEVAVGGLTGLYASCCTPGSTFLQALYTQGRTIDAVGIHPYDINAPDVDVAYESNFTDIGRIRSLMDANGGAGKPIWISEWGWLNNSIADSTRAAYMQTALKMLRELYPYVTVSTFFFDVDTPDYPENGVFETDFSEKAQAQAYAKQVMPLFYWKGTEYAFTRWQEITGLDAHSITKNPLLIDPANGDYTPSLNSPCVDTGVRVTGINDGHLGEAPDIGAKEAP